ncbi:MAG: elongation factor 1-beta [Candidatus Thorarchaeota archaeon]|nr:MAG: elongation factor 1-beta [Candidatus Thorarchaeota archaeon]
MSVLTVARVVITLKILPEDVDVSLDNLLKRIRKVIPKGTEIRATEIVPIAFGLKALRMNVAKDESLGGTDDVEESIKALKGVAQVEVEMVSRV